MTLHVALAVSALAASAILVFLAATRPVVIVALAASAIEVAMAFGVLRLRTEGVPLGLALGLALALPGLVAWFRASSKSAVTAAAILAFTGGLQVFVAASGRI
jgi:hypothetical protein